MDENNHTNTSEVVVLSSLDVRSMTEQGGRSPGQLGQIVNVVY
jgi:hypothetical protein